MPVRTIETRFEELKRLKQVIAENDLECQEVPCDGNSMFAATVDQLFINGIFHISVEILRQSVVQYLRQNPSPVRE